MSLATPGPTQSAPFRFIIVGAGRCGTGYMSKVFQSAGVNCGHETVFGPLGLNAATALRAVHPHLEAEASWLAAPYLDSPLLQSAAVIHLVRDPCRVLASFVNLPIFRTITPFSQFIWEHQPHVFEYSTAVDRAASYFVRWNRWIERLAGSRRIVHRVEDDAAALIRRLTIALDTPALFSDTRYNHRGEPPDVSARDIGDKRLRGQFLELSEQYGYSTATHPRERCVTAPSSVHP